MGQWRRVSWEALWGGPGRQGLRGDIWRLCSNRDGGDISDGGVWEMDAGGWTEGFLVGLMKSKFHVNFATVG